MIILIPILASVITLLFVVSFIGIAFYGVHHGIFTWFAVRRKERPVLPALKETPSVTVQITIYNEGELIEPTIKAVSLLDYPQQQLQIQLCDDSTDGTTSAICRRWQEKLSGQGFQIEHVQREDRKHHKTGNLNNALRTATGEFIVLVDADFLLPPDFLTKNLPFFQEDEKVGAVQSYWTHSNRDDHLLARVMEATYALHLQVEQMTRSNYDLWNEFNGSGGIWRRQVIDEIGGWPVAAVEDVLLSVLAQERGWNIKFSMETTCFGLLPDSLDGYRSQQNRWAIGCGEVLRQKFWDLMRMPRSVAFKIESMFHIAGYFTYVAMTLVMLLTLPMLWVIERNPSLFWMQWFPLACFVVALLGSGLLFAETNRRVGGSFWEKTLRPNLSALEQSGKAPTATTRFLMGLFGMTLKSWQSTNTQFRGIRYIPDKLFESFLIFWIGFAVWKSIQMGFYAFALPAVFYGAGVVFMLLGPLILPGGLLYSRSKRPTTHNIPAEQA